MRREGGGEGLARGAREGTGRVEGERLLSRLPPYPPLLLLRLQSHHPQDPLKPLPLLLLLLHHLPPPSSLCLRKSNTALHICICFFLFST